MGLRVQLQIAFRLNCTSSILPLSLHYEGPNRKRIHIYDYGKEVTHAVAFNGPPIIAEEVSTHCNGQ